MAALKHFLIAGVLAASFFPACNREAKNAENTENQAQAARQDAEKQASEARKTTRKALSDQLDTLDNRIDALEERAGKSGQKMKQSLRDEIAELDKAEDRVEAKLKTLDDASAETFAELSAGVNRSIDSLGQSINRTWKKVTGQDRQAAAPTNDD